MLTLTGVATDRVYAVLMPLRARHGAPRPGRAILALWLISVAAASPMFFIREQRIYEVCIITLSS